MKIFIKTYGCQANINDSEQIAGLLVKGGYELVDSKDKAEAIIVNTCSVKNKTQSKILHYLKELDKGGKKVFVGGCLTKTLDLRKRFPGLNGVFDTNSISKIGEVLENEKDIFSEKKEQRINIPVIRNKQGLGIISIGEGCVNKCTFCATKLARGILRSYRIGDIKRALEQAVKDGCKRIYLTSQDNGCYGFDIGTNLPSLLKELLTVEGEYKIRIGMMNPWHLRKILVELIEVYKNPKVEKFIHLPVQSGSNSVLKHMKRIHSAENFKEAVEKLRGEIPDINIATDIIVGYPTETEEDFQETIKLLEETKPEVINISVFSSRPGTEASRLKQLSSQVIKERSKRLDELVIKFKEELSKKKSSK